MAIMTEAFQADKFTQLNGFEGMDMCSTNTALLPSCH